MARNNEGSGVTETVQCSPMRHINLKKTKMLARERALKRVVVSTRSSKKISRAQKPSMLSQHVTSMAEDIKKCVANQTTLENRLPKFLEVDQHWKNNIMDILQAVDKNATNIRAIDNCMQLLQEKTNVIQKDTSEMYNEMWTSIWGRSGVTQGGSWMQRMEGAFMRLQAEITSIQKDTLEMRKALCDGPESSIVCNAGCRLQVDSLKKQIESLQHENTSFRVSLSRLNALMVQMSRVFKSGSSTTSIQSPRASLMSPKGRH